MGNNTTCETMMAYPLNDDDMMGMNETAASMMIPDCGEMDMEAMCVVETKLEEMQDVRMTSDPEDNSEGSSSATGKHALVSGILVSSMLAAISWL